MKMDDDMNRTEVLKLIGKDRWKEFEKFMAGQTVGYMNGKADYYECDVRRFISNGYLNTENKKVWAREMKVRK
jgi:hypothetical protein